MTSGHDDGEQSVGRRQVLSSIGTTAAATFGVGSLAYRLDRTYGDADGDGLPDEAEQSGSLEEYLASAFGDQFDGLDSRRRDLLVDARYVGGAMVSGSTKTRIRELFRANGIHLQWLDYPRRYDPERFEREYGYEVENILLPHDSFYRTEVADRLKDVAVQLVVLPTDALSGSEQLESFWASLQKEEDDFRGFSVGNRALVLEQEHTRIETRLVLHELAHLGLCHDDDPDNTGVMGPDPREADLTDEEWDRLRNNLDNVRDTTGFDVAFRRCLWGTFLAELFGKPPVG